MDETIYVISKVQFDCAFEVCFSIGVKVSIQDFVSYRIGEQ